MVGRITALNTQQKIPEFNLIVNSVLQPTTHYTCPANKKAIVTGNAYGVTTGAGTVVNLLFAGIRFCQWSAASVDPNVRDNRQLTVPVEVNIELQASETIQTTQDAGTNAQIKLFLKILELPA